jgi:hypothetical protein
MPEKQSEQWEQYSLDPHWVEYNPYTKEMRCLRCKEHLRREKILDRLAFWEKHKTCLT